MRTWKRNGVAGIDCELGTYTLGAMCRYPFHEIAYMCIFELYTERLISD